MPEPSPQRPERAASTVGQGLAMGLADIVPGVSGGTIAMLLGIYTRLITAVAALDVRLARRLLFVFRPGGGAAVHHHAREIDLWFLVRLVLGIGAGIVIGAFTIGALVDTQPVTMMAIFFGLISASARIPLKQVRRPSGRLVGPFAIGLLVAAAVASLPVRSSDVGLVLLFGGGILAAAAMMLPGISGSALMVMIGVYPVVLDAVRQFRFGVLAMYAAGLLVGVVAASRSIRHALGRWHDTTMVALAGFMFGSLVRVWPWRDAPGFGTGAPAMPDSLLPVLFVLLGAAISWGLERSATGSVAPGPPKNGDIER